MITYSRIEPDDHGRKEPRFASSRRSGRDDDVVSPRVTDPDLEGDDDDIAPPRRRKPRRGGSGARLAVIVGLLAIAVAVGLLALTFGGAVRTASVATPGAGESDRVVPPDSADVPASGVRVANSPDTQTTTATRAPAADAKPIAVPPLPNPRPPIIDLNGGTETASTANPDTASPDTTGAAVVVEPPPGADATASTPEPAATEPAATETASVPAPAATDTGDSSVDSLMATVDRIIAEEKVRTGPDSALPGEDGFPMDGDNPADTNTPAVADDGSGAAPLVLDLPTDPSPVDGLPLADAPPAVDSGPVPPADIPNAGPTPAY